jgi:hypothetical protein
MSIFDRFKIDSTIDDIPVGTREKIFSDFLCKWEYATRDKPIFNGKAWDQKPPIVPPEYISDFQKGIWGMRPNSVGISKAELSDMVEASKALKAWPNFDRERNKICNSIIGEIASEQNISIKKIRKLINNLRFEKGLPEPEREIFGNLDNK